MEAKEEVEEDAGDAAKLTVGLNRWGSGWREEIDARGRASSGNNGGRPERGPIRPGKRASGVGVMRPRRRTRMERRSARGIGAGVAWMAGAASAAVEAVAASGPAGATAERALRRPRAPPRREEGEAGVRGTRAAPRNRPRAPTRWPWRGGLRRRPSHLPLPDSEVRRTGGRGPSSPPRARRAGAPLWRLRAPPRAGRGRAPPAAGRALPRRRSCPAVAPRHAPPCPAVASVSWTGGGADGGAADALSAGCRRRGSGGRGARRG